MFAKSLKTVDTFQNALKHAQIKEIVTEKSKYQSKIETFKSTRETL